MFTALHSSYGAHCAAFVAPRSPRCTRRAVLTTFHSPRCAYRATLVSLFSCSFSPFSFPLFPFNVSLFSFSLASLLFPPFSVFCFPVSSHRTSIVCVCLAALPSYYFSRFLIFHFLLFRFPFSVLLSPLHFPVSFSVFPFRFYLSLFLRSLFSFLFSVPSHSTCLAIFTVPGSAFYSSKYAIFR